tara:strand:+ start:2032 stop:2637 length:606 start_codon:yes stop_codon:yes gene_type:complete
MIELKPEGMIGKGLHRECYVHPDNANRCIKVVVLRGEEETRREQAYYKFLQKRQISWEMLPQFYGVEATSMGPGAVFDLVRDADGNVGQTFEHYFESVELTEKNLVGLVGSLQALKSYLFRHNIITMSIKPKNIIYQRQDDKTGTAVIIDNIGNSDAIPIGSYCRYFGKLKMTRKWDKFVKLLKKDYPDNHPLQTQIVTKL